MPARLIVITGTLLFALGCSRGESAPASQPFADAEAAPAPSLPPLDLKLAWSRLPLLPPRVEPSGWSDALRAWETATTAYAKGQVRDASAAFISVAAVLRANTKGAGVRVAATGRCLAYENAARALEAGRDPSGARALLEQAAGEDPACKHSMALRIARLESATTASTAASVRQAGAATP